MPPTQAEMLADAARTKHLPAALIMFEGKVTVSVGRRTHQGGNEVQIYFSARYWSFEPADRVPPIAIDNLPRSRRRSEEEEETRFVSERGRRQRSPARSACDAERRNQNRSRAADRRTSEETPARLRARTMGQRITSAIRATRSVAPKTDRAPLIGGRAKRHASSISERGRLAADHQRDPRDAERRNQNRSRAADRRTSEETRSVSGRGRRAADHQRDPRDAQRRRRHS